MNGKHYGEKMQNRKRPRGFISKWSPKEKARALVSAVQQILEDEYEYLPLTLRQIFYRLVVKDAIEKTEKAYKNTLIETMITARRAQWIDMDAIRDDGFQQNRAPGYGSVDDLIDTILYSIDEFTLDRQLGQEKQLILWCEAAGMVPQLQRVANDFSIPVYSSGGFDSLTSKHKIGRLLGSKSCHILHIGDHDPSGVHIFSSLDEDISAFAKDYGGYPEFTRLSCNSRTG